MPKEIERKFLVKNTRFIEESESKENILQGYLSSVPERTVRIRVKGSKAFITVKGVSDASGISRYEWEKEISVSDAKELLSICEPSIIDKTRYYIKHKNHTFEVDVFHGENKGLVVAEIELSSEDEFFEKPIWLAKEVTGITKYYNSNLIKQAYKYWM